MRRQAADPGGHPAGRRTRRVAAGRGGGHAAAGKAGRVRTPGGVVRALVPWRHGAGGRGAGGAQRDGGSGRGGTHRVRSWATGRRGSRRGDAGWGGMSHAPPPSRALGAGPRRRSPAALGATAQGHLGPRAFRHEPRATHGRGHGAARCWMATGPGPSCWSAPRSCARGAAAARGCDLPSGTAGRRPSATPGCACWTWPGAAEGRARPGWRPGGARDGPHAARLAVGAAQP